MATRAGAPDLANAIWRRRPLAPRARVLQQEMGRAGAYNPHVGMGTSMFGPTLLGIRTGRRSSGTSRRSSKASFAGARAIRNRAPDRTSPAFRPSAARRRGPLAGQRPENLDLGRQHSRLVLLPGAHGPEGQEARRHQLRADRHASAGRRNPADQADRRQLALLRDLLHRRQGGQGRHGRAAERRLDGGQAPAATRAFGPGRRAGLERRPPRAGGILAKDYTSAPLDDKEGRIADQDLRTQPQVTNAMVQLPGPSSRPPCARCWSRRATPGPPAPPRS